MLLLLLFLLQILVWKELDYGIMTEVEKQMLVSEVNLLRELKHQHIVRYYDRIIDRSNTMLYIIMEFCEGGDVGSLIAKMKREGFVCFYSNCIVVGSLVMQFLHSTSNTFEKTYTIKILNVRFQTASDKFS